MSERKKIAECHSCGKVYIVRPWAAELRCICDEEMRFFLMPVGYLLVKWKDEEYGSIYAEGDM